MKSKLRIACISDTHSSVQLLFNIIEQGIKGDIFICAGDFTRYNSQVNFNDFCTFLQKLQFKHKIVISGNHQLLLDQHLHPKTIQRFRQKGNYDQFCTRNSLLNKLKPHCIYLEHQYVEVEGIKMFGSPYTQKYGRTAFQYDQIYDQAIWSGIPENVDILITHSPPYGILDLTAKNINAGSHFLRKKVQKIKPKYHIFGHIHEGHGVHNTIDTTFMNVAKHVQVFDWV